MGIEKMSTPANSEMSKAYDPKEVEGRIYNFWIEGGYFTPSTDPDKKPFVVIMPPPNVTGELHLGHALTASIQDVLCRWHRMLGDATLWLPGKDHAGIATQWVVEQQVARQGTSRQELGREAFVEQVWEWVRRYGNTIDEQHKRLGASCDWSRLCFTLDPDPSLAVRTTFVNLYNKGLVYRGERIINWCPRCSTALSDLEVEHAEQDGSLYFIRYPMQSGQDHIVVATTRPETMLGDTGVAVNPEDERYGAHVGQLAILPIVNREIPVVDDSAIDPQFGTGALKVTPGHDATDFEIGRRHNLPVVTVIEQDGTMGGEAGSYAGVERFQCRADVVQRLQDEGYLEKVEAYRHSVGHCQRCKAVVEPLVSTQWFMDVGSYEDPGSIAGRAYRAVSEGRIRIVPERFSNVYKNWLENIRDWCISRQLWWGHRIPVWYCRSCGESTVSVDDVVTCSHCPSEDLWQDPDVLDTWFSSALWPHSTVGWPGNSDDFSRFYPEANFDTAESGHNSFVMETGYDILFFWVARMIMMGLENTGREPFHTVFLHGLIRDAEGVKMSKTKGNVLDPLQLIEEFGTDALRFALTTGTAPGNDQRLGESKLESTRNFANKLWNASRFVLSNMDRANPSDLLGWRNLDPYDGMTRQDRWILHRLNSLSRTVNRYMEEYELGEAQRSIYEFLWGDYCDWYIEMAKVRMRFGDQSPLKVLAHVLEQTLRLLHPFMPFITEEIWQNLVSRLPERDGLPESIMIAPYPKFEEAKEDASADDEMQEILQVVRAIRNARAQLRIAAGQKLPATLTPGPLAGALKEESTMMEVLATASPLIISDAGSDAGDGDSGPAEQAMTMVVGQVVVKVPLAGVVDISSERERLQGELLETSEALERVRNLLADDKFSSRAPEEVVERERERERSMEERRERLEQVLVQMPS